MDIDAKGPKRRQYKRSLTPLEKLLSLDQPKHHLHQGRTLTALQRVAGALSNTEVAVRLQRTRSSPDRKTLPYSAESK